MAHVNSPLPPVEDVAALEKELALVPPSRREDAVQEAWVAHLEGRSASNAVVAFNMREAWFKRKHVQIEQLEDGEAVAIDRQGNSHPLPARQKSNSSAGPIRRNSLAKAG